MCQLILFRVWMIISLMISDAEHLFMCPLAILYFLFEEMSIWSFCPFFFKLGCSDFFFLNLDFYELFIYFGC